MQQVATSISIENSRLAHTNHVEHLDLWVLPAVLPSRPVGSVTPGPFAAVVVDAEEAVDDDEGMDMGDYDPPIEQESDDREEEEPATLPPAALQPWTLIVLPPVPAHIWNPTPEQVLNWQASYVLRAEDDRPNTLRTWESFIGLQQFERRGHFLAPYVLENGERVGVRWSTRHTDWI